MTDYANLIERLRYAEANAIYPKLCREAAEALEGLLSELAEVKPLLAITQQDNDRIVDVHRKTLDALAARDEQLRVAREALQYYADADDIDWQGDRGGKAIAILDKLDAAVELLKRVRAGCGMSHVLDVDTRAFLDALAKRGGA